MSKLYPPIIGGVIPAFYSGETITIPYQKNRLTDHSLVKEFKMIVKSASTGNQLKILTSSSYSIDDEIENKITFDGDDAVFKPGLYYKVQIAYVKYDGTVGYYSNISTIKCTQKPELSVNYTSNQFSEYTCQGIYSNNDKSEKVLYYQFDIYENSSLFESSGKLLHNSLDDNIDGTATDNYTIKKTIQKNKTYQIVYKVTTINGVSQEISTDEFLISELTQFDSTLKPIATLNREEGYIQVQIVSTDVTSLYMASNFILKRQSSEDNYETSEIVYTFFTDGEPLTDWQWKDFAVKNGCSYIYTVQQYNGNGIYSRELPIEKAVYVNFDYSFLYDGQRQLKIKFDPKVSSFKTNILETKTDTIGSKYPVFYRNDIVDYKEFPISGLISYHSDYEKLFCDWETDKSKDAYKILDLKAFQDFNESDNEVIQEQKFKMQVLDWLNDGQPKLFRSPTEGNYIIKLMNTSLTPNDTLGRMIHSFSSTAYEIADYTYVNLLKYNFVPRKEIRQKNKIILWKQEDIIKGKELITFSPALSLDIRDLPENKTFKFNIKYEGNTSYQTLVVRGGFHIPFKMGVKITSLKYTGSNSAFPGTVVYTYNETASNGVNYIESIETLAWKHGVKVGTCDDIIADIEGAYKIGTGEDALNTRGVLIKFNKFGHLRFFKRPVSETQKIYYKGSFYYFTKEDAEGERKEEVTKDWGGPKWITFGIEDFDMKIFNLDPLDLYEIVSYEEETWKHTGYLDLYQSNTYRNYWTSTSNMTINKLDWYSGTSSIQSFKSYDKKPGDVYLYHSDSPSSSSSIQTIAFWWKPKVIPKEEYNCHIIINDRLFDIKNTEQYTAPINDDMQYSSVAIGPGVIAEFLYKSSMINYNFDALLKDLPSFNGANALKHAKGRYAELLTCYENDAYYKAPDNIDQNIFNADNPIQFEYKTNFDAEFMNNPIWKEEYIIHRSSMSRYLALLNSTRKTYEIALTCAIYEAQYGKSYVPNWGDAS